MYNRKDTTKLQMLSYQNILKSVRTLAKRCNQKFYLYTSATKSSCGNMTEDIENNHTKVDNDYPHNKIKEYQLLNDLKQFKHRQSQITEAGGVTFAQEQKHIHQNKRNWIILI